MGFSGEGAFARIGCMSELEKPVIVGFVADLLTRNPTYLYFSGQVFRYAVIVALLFFALLILERVAIIPL